MVCPWRYYDIAPSHTIFSIKVDSKLPTQIARIWKKVNLKPISYPIWRCSGFNQMKPIQIGGEVSLQTIFLKTKLNNNSITYHICAQPPSTRTLSTYWYFTPYTKLTSISFAWKSCFLFSSKRTKDYITNIELASIVKDFYLQINMNQGYMDIYLETF